MNLRTGADDAAARGGFLRTFAGVFLIVFAVRLALVLAGAPEIPFYDEWDGVIEAMARALRTGSFSFAFFLAPHNEHTLLWTKLLSYVVLRAGDGQFDNVPVCEISQLLFALMVAAAAAAVAQRLGRFAPAFVACVVVITIVPYDWETIGVGWGNPYYFLIGFTLAAIALATTIHGVVGCVFLAFAIFAASAAMGSGLFAGAAALGVLALRTRIGDIQIGTALRLAALPACALLAAAALTVHPHRVVIAWGWLATFELVIVCVLMFPTWTLLTRVLRGQGDRIDIAFVATASWGAAQFVAILIARPEFRLWFPVSRYVDVLAVLAFANLGCLCRIGLAVPQRPAWLRLSWLALAAALAMGVGFVPLAWHYTQWRADNERVQTQRLTRYIRGGDTVAIDEAPPDELPYPSRGRLRTLIDAPDVREILGDRVGTRASPAPFVAGARAFDAALVRNGAWLLSLTLACGVIVLVRWRRLSAVWRARAPGTSPRP